MVIIITMFKFFLYISLCVSLIYYSFATIENPRLEVLGVGEYCIYSTQEVVSEFITKRIETGIGYIYYCSSDAAEKVRALFNKIDGESIKLYIENHGRQWQSQLDDILQKLDYHYHKISETYDGIIRIYYAYSNRVKDFINIGKDKINLQIAQRGDVIVIGWPVILGSY